VSSNPPDSLSLERARHQGREAFYAGMPGESCPYPQGSEEWDIWWGAWQAAREYRELLDQHLLRQA
jgi:ribosome modulation factor